MNNFNIRYTKLLDSKRTIFLAETGATISHQGLVVTWLS